MADTRNLKFGTTTINSINAFGGTNNVNKVIVNGTTRFHNQLEDIYLSFIKGTTSTLEYEIFNDSGRSIIINDARVNGSVQYGSDNYIGEVIPDGGTLSITLNTIPAGTSNLYFYFLAADNSSTNLKDLSYTDGTGRATLSVPAAPSIVYKSATTSSLTFTVTNNANEECRIYYEHSDSSPDAHYVTLAAGASQDVTESSLSTGTSYTVYAESQTTVDSIRNTSQVSASGTTSANAIPTTRIGAWQGSGTQGDTTWRVKLLDSIGSSYNGRSARLVFVYRTKTTGTTYRGDIQVDRIRYGGITFDFDSGEDWRKEASITSNNVIGTFATRVGGSNNAIGTSVSNGYWSRDANATGSSQTGGAISAYGGYCLYPETSGSVLGDYFWAMSPVFTYNYSTTRDIILAMEGISCGTLAVYIIDSTTTNFTPSLSSPDDYYDTGGGGVTPNPTINDNGCHEIGGTKYANWDVTNNDTVTTTIYTEASDSTPDLYSPSVGAGNDTPNYTKASVSDVTVYAYALTSGKTASSTVSRVIDMDFCGLAG